VGFTPQPGARAETDDADFEIHEESFVSEKF